MNTSQCAVYQVKDTPEYRDVRFRSYEKLKSEGRTVQVENYQQVYIGRIQPGETPADIKLRLQKQRPKNFKGVSSSNDLFLVWWHLPKATELYPLYIYLFPHIVKVFRNCSVQLFRTVTEDNP